MLKHAHTIYLHNILAYSFQNNIFRNITHLEILHFSNEITTVQISIILYFSNINLYEQVFILMQFCIKLFLFLTN